LISGIGQHRGQFSEPVQTIRDPPLADQPALIVDQRDVVMPFRPVDATVHRHRRISFSI
jgi:hypothetical protein